MRNWFSSLSALDANYAGPIIWLRLELSIIIYIIPDKSLTRMDLPGSYARAMVS